MKKAKKYCVIGFIDDEYECYTTTSFKVAVETLRKWRDRYGYYVRMTEVLVDYGEAL